MSKPKLDPSNWRNDTGMEHTIIYTIKFSIFPKKLEDRWVWLKKYVKGREYWHKSGNELRHSHPEKPFYISTEEYIVRKLAE